MAGYYSQDSDSAYIICVPGTYSIEKMTLGKMPCFIISTNCLTSATGLLLAWGGKRPSNATGLYYELMHYGKVQPCDNTKLYFA